MTEEFCLTIDGHLRGLHIEFRHAEVERILAANGYTNLRPRRPGDSSDGLWVCDGPKEKFLNATCVLRDIFRARLMDVLTR